MTPIKCDVCEGYGIVFDDDAVDPNKDYPTCPQCKGYDWYGKQKPVVKPAEYYADYSSNYDVDGRYHMDGALSSDMFE